MASNGDVAVLTSIGHDLIQSFVPVVVETFIIGDTLVIVVNCLAADTGTYPCDTSGVFSSGIGNRRRSNTRISVYTCLAVFIMYGLALSLWMIDIHNVVTEIQTTLLSPVAASTGSLANAYSIAMSKILRLSSVEDVLYAYMTNIGDGIIIWRAYAFWSNGRERFILLIPLAFLAGSIYAFPATSIMLTYCAARLGADITLGTYQHPAFCRNIQTASYSTTLATTTVTTVLLAYKTWKYRRMHINAFGKSSTRTRTQKIMVMLIESGILYMLFFVVQVIMSLDSVNTSLSRNEGLAFAATVYQYITSLIVGIYPTVVVILVNSKHSVLNMGTAVASSVISPAHMRSVGSSGTTYSSTVAAGMDQSMHSPATAIDLYNIARIGTASSGEPVLTPLRGV
ncbi:hypothetical protein FOMPIDRAFT_1026808 [Fomitopsis schrenkii]|uniref:G-protein coupled receptors family 1 profile domain-containing protein n=1 Tax=Fomitopsis schrenkii TaxID=2126942 RepID=S8EP82_FOMSC|nr:hypothetical protein FOMPIDRAFT_1026808 [Fomitopsis schrenkii]